MRSVPIQEARKQFSELLDAVEHGEEIMITRHGSPVARIVAAESASASLKSRAETVKEAMSQLRELGRGSSLGTGLADAIEEGRD